MTKAKQLELEERLDKLTEQLKIARRALASIIVEDNYVCACLDLAAKALSDMEEAE